MKRKYLDDLNVTDRWDQWYEDNPRKMEKLKREQEIYGFDSRETYSLRETYFEWLYERVSMFKEKAQSVIDIESDVAHHFEYNGESVPMIKLIDKIINNLEEYLTEHRHAPTLDMEEQLFNKAMEAAKIFVLILPSMWW